MRIGIHQINFFPWFGYFNKMAKSDCFIYLDKVQLADRGPSQRTYLLENGEKANVSVGIKRKGHRDKKFNEIEINDNSPWKEKLYQFIQNNYSDCKFYQEIKSEIDSVIDIDSNLLMDINLASIEMIKNILGINTKTIMQSSVIYDETAKKGDLMMQLTKAVGGDVYLSGIGAKDYMDLGPFSNNNIKVQYQSFNPFSYKQKSNTFVPGLSTLDALFNIGPKECKKIFWNNIQNTEVYEN